MSDLKAMRLVITDFTADNELADAIRRYHTLLQMTFATNIYKVLETPTSQIYRFMTPQPQGIIPIPGPQQEAKAIVDVRCGQCQTITPVQANLGKAQPIEPGRTAFPKNNRFKCPKCHAESDITQLRQQLEGQTGLKLIT